MKYAQMAVTQSAYGWVHTHLARRAGQVMTITIINFYIFVRICDDKYNSVFKINEGEKRGSYAPFGEEVKKYEGQNRVLSQQLQC